MSLASAAPCYTQDAELATGTLWPAILQRSRSLKKQECMQDACALKAGILAGAEAEE